MDKFLSSITITAFIIATICVSFAYLAEQKALVDTVVVSDYIGKVIQIDHVATTSGGFLSSSTRQDTYVTFDNGVTYWFSGYVTIIEGYTYHVHSVQTTSYGARAMGNGTLTRTLNTFTLISMDE